MNLSWKTYSENLGTGQPIAILFNGNKDIILQVFEEKNCYCSQVASIYRLHIHSCPVPYVVLNNFIKTLDPNLSIEEVNKERIKFICNYVEVDFKHQVNDILNLFV